MDLILKKKRFKIDNLLIDFLNKCVMTNCWILRWRIDFSIEINLNIC